MEAHNQVLGARLQAGAQSTTKAETGKEGFGRHQPPFCHTAGKDSLETFALPEQDMTGCTLAVPPLQEPQGGAQSHSEPGKGRVVGLAAGPGSRKGL